MINTGGLNDGKDSDLLQEKKGWRGEMENKVQLHNPPTLSTQ